MLNKKLLHYLRYQLVKLTNPLVKKQRNNPASIPVLIINFNQLFYLKQLLGFLQERNFSNIIIIDNNSTYEPLLAYYREITPNVKIERLEYNGGHNVFFKNKSLRQQYGKGYFILTDADIVPNPHLPNDFVKKMISYLDQYFNRITKVGFALEIQSIPDHYLLKDKVQQWEKNFWTEELEKEVYLAEVDTTFALYKPNYPEWFHNNSFYSALRLSGDFTAVHGGWYMNSNNPTEEQKYYLKTANTSASWKYDDNGHIINDQFKKIY